MTLIEILIFYREAVRDHGRKLADVWLHGVCDPYLWNHIYNSVDDTGAFLSVDGPIKDLVPNLSDRSS